jgi:hypothetical protein
MFLCYDITTVWCGTCVIARQPACVLRLEGLGLCVGWKVAIGELKAMNWLAGWTGQCCAITTGRSSPGLALQDDVSHND